MIWDDHFSEDSWWYYTFAKGIVSFNSAAESIWGNCDVKWVDSDRTTWLNRCKHLPITFASWIPESNFLESLAIQLELLVNLNLKIWDDYCTLKVRKEYSIHQVVVCDGDSIVIEDEDIIVGPTCNVEEMFTLNPISVNILPIADDGVLIGLCTRCFVLLNNNQRVSIKRLLTFIRPHHMSHSDTWYVDSPNIISLIVCGENRVVNVLDFIDNSTDCSVGHHFAQQHCISIGSRTINDCTKKRGILRITKRLLTGDGAAVDLAIATIRPRIVDIIIRNELCTSELCWE